MNRKSESHLQSLAQLPPAGLLLKVKGRETAPQRQSRPFTASKPTPIISDKFGNLINKNTGNWLCFKCKAELKAGVQSSIGHFILCNHCSDIMNGIRDKAGKLK